MKPFVYYATLDENHEVMPTLDVKVWEQFFGDFEKRVVDQTHLNGFFISTVFLGIDHGFGTRKPWWFETEIFDQRKPDPDSLGDVVHCWRYTTWKEAAEGHAAAIELVRKFSGL